jgi:hypothetical protein
MRLLKLHCGLFRYIKNEIPKQKGFRQVVKFFLNISKAYYIAMLNEYRYFLKQFDPDYHKQKAQIKKYRQYKKDLTNAYKLLQFMIKQGQDRTERKQIKADFINFGKISEKTQAIIMKEIYGGK